MLTIEQANEIKERQSRFFASPANGATVATHGARNNAEQEYGIASRALMKHGVLMPLKKKYNPHR